MKAGIEIEENAGGKTGKRRSVNDRKEIVDCNLYPQKLNSNTQTLVKRIAKVTREPLKLSLLAGPKIMKFGKK